MSEIIVCFILFIPVYGFLFWSYFCPEDSLLLGKRWMFKEEPEISEGAIRYTKVASIIGLTILTLFFGFSIIMEF